MCLSFGATCKKKKTQELLPTQYSRNHEIPIIQPQPPAGKGCAPVHDTMSPGLSEIFFTPNIQVQKWVLRSVLSAHPPPTSTGHISWAEVLIHTRGREVSEVNESSWSLGTHFSEVPRRAETRVSWLREKGLNTHASCVWALGQPQQSTTNAVVLTSQKTWA